MSKAMSACRRYGKLHDVVRGGSAIAHKCEETLAQTLALQVTLPLDSWPQEMSWS